MTKNSIAMLDKDHHIHLIPSERVVMLSLEHAAIRKTETEHFEVACTIRLVAEGVSHPFEDTIRFTFASARVPGPDLMTELSFVQNHIIKNVFDRGVAGELTSCPPDDPLEKVTGITISYEIRTLMQRSKQLWDVLARHGALSDTMVFTR
jgi:hypothetical protein